MRRLFALSLLLLLLSGCTQLIFQPMRPHRNDPAQLGITVEEHSFTTEDGLRLHGWRLPAQGELRGTLLLLHGNAENISTHIGSVWWLPQHGYSVYLFDYRGYGQSEGSPSLDGLMLDLRAAMQWVLGSPEARDKGLVVFGQSLGASIAVSGLARMAQREAIRGVVLEGGMTSFRQVARELLANSWLTWLFQWPLSFTIDDRYRPIDDIAKLEGIPLLLIHSRSDAVIPFHHGEELFAAAREPKAFWPLEQGAHIAAFAEEQNQRRLLEWLGRHFP